MKVPKASITHLSSSCSAPYRSVCRFQSFQLLHCSVQWQERLGLWSICSLSCRRDLVDFKSSFIITAQIQNDVSLFERKYSLRMPTLQFTLYDSFAEAAKAKSTSTSLFEQKLPSSASTVFSWYLPSNSRGIFMEDWNLALPFQQFNCSLELCFKVN